VARQPGVGDLIALRNAGVSDRVIQALQQTPPPTPLAYARDPRTREVVVERYYGPGHCPPPYVYYHHRPYYYPGLHWGFSFSD
jgi:hypothetical protein